MVTITPEKIPTGKGKQTKTEYRIEEDGQLIGYARTAQEAQQTKTEIELSRSKALQLHGTI